MERFRLTISMESRIHGDVYVRFGGEHMETYCRNTIRRWVLSLHAWCEEECRKVFKYVGYQHYWNKWCIAATPTPYGAAEKFYAELTTHSRTLLVNRACEVYDGSKLREPLTDVKAVYRCNECGSTDVQINGWVDPNNDNQYVSNCSDGEDDDNLCNNCGAHGPISLHGEFMKEVVNYWWNESATDEDIEAVTELTENDFSSDQEFRDACDAVWNSITDEEKIEIWKQINYQGEDE